MASKVDTLSKIIDSKILKKANKTSFLSPIADKLVKLVRVRTRKGYGVDREGGSEKRFPALKESTIKSRQRKYKAGKLQAGVGPKTNALIETGQLHDAISQVTKFGKSTLYLKSRRKGSTKLSNPELAEIQEANGRAFMHVSRKEEKEVNRLIRKGIKALIRKF